MARVIAFFFAATLTRRLGASGYGELAFATALTGYVVLVPSLAIQDLGIRAVARAPAAAPRIAASVTQVRLVFSVFAVLVVSALALALPLLSAVKALVALSALAIVPQAINAAWGYKAIERIQRVSLSLIVMQVVCLVGAFGFIHQGTDLLRVPVVQAVGELAAAALLFPLLWRGWKEGTLREGMSVLKGAGTLVVNRFLRAIIVTADMVLLGLLVTSAQVGLYSAAYRVCFLLTAIATSAHVVFQPAVMRAEADPVQASAVLTNSVWMAWAVGLPLIVGGIIVAPDLLAFLFGEPFRAGQQAFRILLLSTGLLFLHGTMNPAYLARHRLGLQTWVLGSAAALNLLLNGLLIRPLGIVGSAIATAAAEGIILASSTIVLWRWHWRPDIKVLFKPALAALGMAVGLEVLPAGWHVAIRIGVGGVIYFGLLTLLNGLPPQLSHPMQRLFAR